MKNLSGFLLIAALFVIYLSGCSNSMVTRLTPTTEGSKYPINSIPRVLGDDQPIIFELGAPLPDFPEKLQVYQMVKPEIDEEYVRNLGEKFGITGDVSFGTDKRFHMGNLDTQETLEVIPPTGTFRYTVESKLFPETKPDLPSEAEALKIATDYLVERGLLPEGDVAYKVVAGGGAGPDFTTHLLVSFKHEIEIIGPGARHGLRIGDGGDVIDVFINPTNPLVLPPLEMAAAKSVKQAYLELLEAKTFAAPSATQKVRIESVTVAYWLEPTDVGQDYVAPVYQFIGSCLDKTGKMLDTPFTGVMEALK